MRALRRVVSLGRSGRAATRLAIAAGVVATGSAVGLGGVSAWLIVRAAERPPVLHLMVAIVAVRTFGIARGVFRYGERLVAHDGAFRVLGDLRAAVVSRLARVLPSPAGATRGEVAAGEVSSTFVRDVDGLLDLWVRVAVPVVVTVGVAAGATVASALILPAAGVGLAVSLAVAGLLAPWTAARWASSAQRRLVPERAEMRTRLLEVLDGAPALAVDGRLDAELAELDRLDERLRGAEVRTAAAAGLATALALMASGVAVAVAMVAARAAVAAGGLGGPAAAVVVLVPLAVHEAVAALASVGASLPGLVSSAERLLAVLDTPDPVREPHHPLDAPTGDLGVRLVDVTAGWSADRPVLHGCSAVFSPGTTSAVVGPSGVGKSTLAALLAKFVDPVEGRVELIGRAGAVGYEHLHGDEVRRVVGWCAQDAHVFDSTVRANLLLARPDADDARLWAALDLASLGAFVRSLPDGLDTFVGEHGRALSGGERQRLSLARVLLADPRIVVFDEPTEHVDDLAARELTADLLDATRSRTTVFVTHRTDLIEAFRDRFDAVVPIAGEGVTGSG
ncbi:MAG: thiol reductant ABC exporter subunit CydC [Acidimicrobiales bacterium]